MSAPQYARMVSRVLARAEFSGPPPAPSPEARARAIAELARAIRARARIRRIRRWTALAMAVAAVFAVSFGVARYSARPGLQLSQPQRVVATPAHDARIVARSVGIGAGILVSGVSGASAPLAQDAVLSAGSRLVTPAGGSAMLSFSTGTRAMLSASGDLTVVGEGDVQVLRLDAGSVDLHVAKLHDHQRFLVDTSDAEVEVRGTRFRVSLVPSETWCGGGAVTRVSVVEGVVVVRHAGVESRIAAGEEWPSGCVRPASVALARFAPAHHAPRAAVDAAVDAALDDRALVSSLRAQNALFAEAVVAKHRGNTRDALAGFARLLSTYPASPLAESATVERMRLLRTASPEGADLAARSYLERYPNGFARAEAEEVVAKSRSQVEGSMPAGLVEPPSRPSQASPPGSP